MIGFLPAVFTGAALGRLAHRLREWRSWLRGVVLVLPALLVVIGLADVFQMQRYIVVASIPTLAASLRIGGAERSVGPSRGVAG